MDTEKCCMAKAKKDIHSSTNVFEAKAVELGNLCREGKRLSKVDVVRGNSESDGTNQDLCKSRKNDGRCPHPNHAEHTLKTLRWKNDNGQDQRRNIRRI